MEDAGKATAQDESQQGDNPSPPNGETESAEEERPERERDEDGGDQDAPPQDVPPQEARQQDARGIPARQDAEIPDGRVARTTTTERTWDQDPTTEPDPERGAVSDARAREHGLLEGHPEDRGADEASEMEPDEG